MSVQFQLLILSASFGVNSSIFEALQMHF